MCYRNHEEIISERFREVEGDKTAPKVTVGLLPPSPGFRLPTSSGCSTTLSPGLIAKLWCLNCKEAPAIQSQDHSLSLICPTSTSVFPGRGCQANPFLPLQNPSPVGTACCVPLVSHPWSLPICIFASHCSLSFVMLMYSVPSVFPPNPGLIHSVHVFW